MNFEDDAKVSHTKPVAVLKARHFLDSLAARVFGELVKRFIKSELELPISNFAERLYDGRP